jgi:preprotein translocase subunit SecE
LSPLPQPPLAPGDEVAGNFQRSAGNVAKARAKTATSVQRGSSIISYLNDTRAELRKVTWPTRQESWNLTLIVLGATVVMAIFLGLLDFIFQTIVSGILQFSWVWVVIAVVVLIAGSAIFIFNSREQ